MTDRDALYAAVLAAPDDDTPRLVYADYLDDTGARADAIRARFIRNQVALARAEPWSDEYDRLVRATHPVEYHFGPDWSPDETEIASDVRYGRGFVEMATCTTDRFLSGGQRLFESHPVRSVILRGLTAGPGDPRPLPLAASPLLSRLEALDISVVPPGDGFLSDLWASPHVAGLRRLRVGWDDSDDTPLRDIGVLLPPSLTTLDLSGNVAIGDRLVRALVADPAFSQLTALDLAGTVVGPDGFTPLADSPHAINLRRLRLGVRRLNTEGVAVALARSPHLRGLIELDLENVALDGRTGVAFAEAYSWPALRRLGLRRTRIALEAIPALAANPLVRSLAAIDLRNTSIHTADLFPLREVCPDIRLLTDDTEVPVPINLAPEDRL